MWLILDVQNVVARLMASKQTGARRNDPKMPDWRRRNPHDVKDHCAARRGEAGLDAEPWLATLQGMSLNEPSPQGPIVYTALGGAAAGLLRSCARGRTDAVEH